MAKRKLTFTITQAPSVFNVFNEPPTTGGEFYWHAKLGKITCDGGEGYSTRSNAKRAIKALVAHIQQGEIELP